MLDVEQMFDGPKLPVIAPANPSREEQLPADRNQLEPATVGKAPAGNRGSCQKSSL